MSTKVLICLYGNEVNPRFDMATEVLIASIGEDRKVQGERVVVLPQASAERLCHMILTESIQVVICGGIEEEYYQYLTWKRVNVLDSVIGDYKEALARLAEGRLQAGDMLGEREELGLAGNAVELRKIPINPL
jgi:predicted Fe-Mo cluster-binding NifX family protein